MDIKYKLLDIGCGSNKCKPDATGIDISPGPGVDLVGDALEILRGMDADTVGGIYSSHFLEHHVSPAEILREMVRVTAPGGVLELKVPHFSDPWFYSDPTHKHAFGLYTFAYYFSGAVFSRKVPTYVTIQGARIESVFLRFGSTRPFYARHALKKVVQGLVNVCNYSREIYEEMFSSVVRCSEIHVVVRVDS